jgi:hypothetical protein
MEQRGVMRWWSRRREGVHPGQVWRRGPGQAWQVGRRVCSTTLGLRGSYPKFSRRACVSALHTVSAAPAAGDARG